MPMVPTFQNNIPSVRDNGGSGMVPAQQVRSNFNYPEVMKEALKPINEAAQTVQEVLKINHARTVKAESDDTDNKAMGIVDQIMYDPQNGYMAKQGKNAMDAYQSTVEGMKAELDKLVGGLQPATRDAVASRIADRFQSAVRQATQWNAQQTRNYHLSSSQSSVEASIKDIGNHYADLPYLNKSWASIVQQLDYQAQLQGLPPEVTKLLKDNTYDLFQAQRYQVWGEDDPSTAFRNFVQNDAGLSADIRLKIRNGLFAKAKGSLALGLVTSGTDSWLNKDAKTGDPFIDSLPIDERIEIISAASKLVKTADTQAQANIKSLVEDNLAQAEVGVPNEMITQDVFESQLGKEKGRKQYLEYAANYRVAQFKSGTFGLTNQDMDRIVSEIRPREGDPDFAERLKLSKSMKKAVDEIKEARSEDPIQYAMDNTPGNIPSINDWSQNASFKTVTSRLGVARQVTQMYDTPDALFTHNELKGLTDHYESLDAQSKVVLLGNLYKSMQEPTPVVDDYGEMQIMVGSPEYGLGAVIGQLTDQKVGSEMRTALMLMTDNNPNLGSKYVIGKQRLADGNAVVNEKAAGDLAWFNQKIGTDEESAGVFDREDDLKIAQDAFVGVYAFNQQGVATVEDTFEECFGDVADWNGKKILLPRRKTNNKVYADDSWFTKDFNDLIDDSIKRLEKESGEVVFWGNRYKKADFAKFFIKNAQLQTVGNGRYYIKNPDGSGYAQNSDGSYFVLDVLEK